VLISSKYGQKMTLLDDLLTQRERKHLWEPVTSRLKEVDDHFFLQEVPKFLHEQLAYLFFLHLEYFVSVEVDSSTDDIHNNLFSSQQEDINDAGC
jgi:hypothetical protein